MFKDSFERADALENIAIQDKVAYRHSGARDEEISGIEGELLQSDGIDLNDNILDNAHLEEISAFVFDELQRRSKYESYPFNVYEDRIEWDNKIGDVHALLYKFLLHFSTSSSIDQKDRKALELVSQLILTSYFGPKWKPCVVGWPRQYSETIEDLDKELKIFSGGIIQLNMREIEESFRCPRKQKDLGIDFIIMLPSPGKDMSDKDDDMPVDGCFVFIGQVSSGKNYSEKIVNEKSLFKNFLTLKTDPNLLFITSLVMNKHDIYNAAKNKENIVFDRLRLMESFNQCSKVKELRTILESTQAYKDGFIKYKT